MEEREERTLLTDEIADFLARCPTREQLLKFSPSPRTRRRAKELLDKSKVGQISADERWELDQFDFAESLLQQVKARLRASRAAAP
jgi:hypothetical protein